MTSYRGVLGAALRSGGTPAESHKHGNPCVVKRASRVAVVESTLAPEHATPRALTRASPRSLAGLDREHPVAGLSSSGQIMSELRKAYAEAHRRLAAQARKRGQHDTAAEHDAIAETYERD